MTDQKAIQKHSKECIHRIEVIEGFMKTNPNDKECVKNIEVLTAIVKILEEIQQYQALGTVEELRDAREKQRAKKPFIQKTDEKTLYKCPCCKKVFVEAYENLQRGCIPKYCEMCGQSIDF